MSEHIAAVRHHLRVHDSSIPHDGSRGVVALRRAIGSLLDEVAELRELASSSDSAEPGRSVSVPVPVPAPVSVPTALSEHELQHVLTELASNMEPGADEDAICEELDDYSPFQVEQILRRWAAGQVVDFRRHLDATHQLLDEFDSDRMDQVAFEKERELPIEDRIRNMRTYVEKLEAENTGARIAELRRIREPSEPIDVYEVRIANQREQIEYLHARVAELTERAGAPVPTHDQLVAVLGEDDPGKIYDAVSEVVTREPENLRSCIVYALVAVSRKLQIPFRVLGRDLVDDMFALDAEQTPPNDSPCDDSPLSRMKGVWTDHKVTHRICTCNHAISAGVDPFCPTHGQDADADEPEDASLEQTDEDRKYTRGTDWEDA